MKGPVDHTVLGNALNELIKRQSVRRTSYGMGPAGELIQRVDPDAMLRLEIIDLGDEAESERERIALARSGEMAALPFDLGRPPLIRAALSRLDARDSILLLVTHYIAADGWSLRLILEELSESYAAGLEGRAPRLPALPLTYIEYAKNQRDRLKNGELDAARKYWTRVLQGVPAITEVPASFPRPVRQVYSSIKFAFTTPPDLSHAVLHLSRDENATPFMTWLALFAALLHRVSLQEDIVIGAVVSNRNRAEFEQLLGGRRTRRLAEEIAKKVNGDDAKKRAEKLIANCGFKPKNSKEEDAETSEQSKVLVYTALAAIEARAEIIKQ